MSLIDILVKGGVLMLPIVVCSIYAAGIIIERLGYYRRARGRAKRLQIKLEPLIVGNRLSEARVLCEEARGIVPALYLSALRDGAREGSMEVPVEDELQAARRIIDEELQVSVLPALEKHLNALDALARGTPLLGLLGTVIGMIRVFFTMGTGSHVTDPGLLSKGIGLALVSTAAGLIVAIPAFFFHRYFSGRVDHFLEEAQKAKAWLLTQLSRRRLIYNIAEDEQ